MLVCNQAIHMPQIPHNLLCPMQMRLNEVEVDEKPKFLTNNPTEKSHAVVLKNEKEELLIPLHLSGVTSYFATRKPTREEYEASDSIFELTAESPEWDPQSTKFSNEESELLDYKGSIVPGKAPHR